MSKHNVTSGETFWTTGRIIATVVVAALIATIGYTLLGARTDVKTDSKVMLPGTPVSDSGPYKVPPDYDVTMWPKDVIAGKDPQLEKAIELAMEALKKSPPKKDTRPEYPKRAKP